MEFAVSLVYNEGALVKLGVRVKSCISVRVIDYIIGLDVVDKDVEADAGTVILYRPRLNVYTGGNKIITLEYGGNSVKHVVVRFLDIGSNHFLEGLHNSVKIIGSGNKVLPVCILARERMSDKVRSFVYRAGMPSAGADARYGASSRGGHNILTDARNSDTASSLGIAGAVVLVRGSGVLISGEIRHVAVKLNVSLVGVCRIAYRRSCERRGLELTLATRSAAGSASCSGAAAAVTERCAANVTLAVGIGIRVLCRAGCGAYVTGCIASIVISMSYRSLNLTNVTLCIACIIVGMGYRSLGLTNVTLCIACIIVGMGYRSFRFANVTFCVAGIIIGMVSLSYKEAFVTKSITRSLFEPF